MGACKCTESATGALQVATDPVLRSMVCFLTKKHMKQLLVEVDEETFKKLEQIAPARSRRRSAFIRAALHKAICEEQERATAEAYRKVPDSADDVWFNPRVWEPKPPAFRR